MPGTSALKASAWSRTASAGRLRFGDCDICQQTHTLWREGQPRKIRRKPFEVLLLLIDQRPQTLSHERIARAVWGSKSVPAQQVARAVMEARREIGDDPEAPRCILSVRGIGYRFAAEVSLFEISAATGPEGVSVDASEARTGIEAAATCMRRGNFAEAQRLVDRAISAADLAGARPELAKAMALAASVVLRVGSREHALTLATKALRLAQVESRSDAVADAQLSMSEIHLWMGSAHAAFDHLLAAHRVLAAQAPSYSLWRCESLLSMAYREIGRADEALPWCEQALASALKLDPEGRAIRERLAMVGVLRMDIDAALVDGREAEVRACGERALELLELTEADARLVGAPVYELISLTFRAILFESLGRVSEGWAVLEKLRPILFGNSVAPEPWLEFRRREFMETEAGLLSRSGRSAEAVEVIEAAVAAAPKGNSLPMELANAQALAAKICERGGLFPEAMVWMRRQLHTMSSLHADRAQATATIVRAQMESDRLGEELAQARAEAQRLRQLNHELERRIAQMDRNPLLDEGGLVPATALAATIDGRAALARERGLPLCIGIVESFPSTEDEGDGKSLALRRRLKLLSTALKAVIPEASAPAQWRPGVYVFAIPDMGLGPARQKCQLLAHHMNTEAIPTVMSHATVSHRADAVDVTGFTSLELALGPLPDMDVQAVRADPPLLDEK